MVSAQPSTTFAATGWPSEWVSAHAAENPIDATFANLNRALADAPGHRLLTVLVYFETLGESQRAYSSKPFEYPIGGRKTLGQAPRCARYSQQRRPSLGARRKTSSTTTLTMTCC